VFACETKRWSFTRVSPIISGMLLCCKKICRSSCGGPFFCGTPVRPNMLSMSESAAGKGDDEVPRNWSCCLWNLPLLLILDSQLQVLASLATQCETETWCRRAPVVASRRSSQRASTTRRHRPGCCRSPSRRRRAPVGRSTRRRSGCTLTAHSSVARPVDVDPPVLPPPPPHGRPAPGRSGHDRVPTALQALPPYAKLLLHPSQPRTGAASSSRSFRNCANVPTTLSVSRFANSTDCGEYGHWRRCLSETRSYVVRSSYVATPSEWSVVVHCTRRDDVSLLALCERRTTTTQQRRQQSVVSGSSCGSTSKPGRAANTRQLAGIPVQPSTCLAGVFSLSLSQLSHALARNSPTQHLAQFGKRQTSRISSSRKSHTVPRRKYRRRPKQFHSRRRPTSNCASARRLRQL